MVYADDGNTVGYSIHTGKKLVEFGLEENAGKTKYKNMSWDQNARRSQGIKYYNSYFERVEVFK